jgi:flagellar biosynthetic protein FliR
MNELLRLAWPDIVSFLFVFIRIGIIFATIPLFSTEILPRRITAILAFFLSLVLMPIVPPAEITLESLTLLSLIVLVLHELLIGLCLGLAVNVIFAGVQIAGQLAGFQMGFAIANVVDPMTGENAPITANVLYITTFLLFLSFGGHHMLIKALVESFYIIPIEARFANDGYLVAALQYAAQMFVIAIKVAAPVIGVLLLINIAFAITARAIPQMNVFIMAFPLTIAIGLVFITVVMKFMPHLVSVALNGAWAFMMSSLSLF